MTTSERTATLINELELCMMNPDVRRDAIATLRELDRNAARYQWLREQNWYENRLSVVVRPKDQVKLGTDCPSRERLDAAIDEAMTMP